MHPTSLWYFIKITEWLNSICISIKPAAIKDWVWHLYCWMTLSCWSLTFISVNTQINKLEAGVLRSPSHDMLSACGTCSWFKCSVRATPTYSHIKLANSYKPKYINLTIMFWDLFCSILFDWPVLWLSATTTTWLPFLLSSVESWI